MEDELKMPANETHSSPEEHTQRKLKVKQQILIIIYLRCAWACVYNL